MNVKKYLIHHKNPRGDFMRFDLDDIVLPADFDIKEKTVYYFPPNDVGGNHSHPRKEAFIGIGDLELSWIYKGETHTEHMFTDNKPYLYIIPPHIPHIVRNLSLSQFAILIEYADGPQIDVKKAGLPL